MTKMDDDTPVKLMHSVFRDFLTDHERAKHFSVDLIQCHRDIAHFCLKLMTVHLKRDICRLDSGVTRSRRANMNQNDLEQRRDAYISKACLPSLVTGP